MVIFRSANTGYCYNSKSTKPLPLVWLLKATTVTFVVTLCSADDVIYSANSGENEAEIQNILHYKFLQVAQQSFTDTFTAGNKEQLSLVLRQSVADCKPKVIIYLFSRQSNQFVAIMSLKTGVWASVICCDEKSHFTQAHVFQQQLRLRSIVASLRWSSHQVLITSISE